MASTSETGHTKNVANLETLIIRCEGFGPPYDPSNEMITIPNLKAYHQESELLLEKVKKTERPFKDVEGQRKLIFKPLRTKGTKILNAFKGASSPAAVIADAKTVNRKLQGKRADNSPIVTPVGKTPKDKISVSQQSYEMQVDHFEKLIEIATIEPTYKPNEVPLKVVTLNAYKDQLKAINKEVKNPIRSLR